MIPLLVPRKQLLAANGVFTLTLNAAFALGFALLGPIVVTLVGAPALILLVAALLPRRRGLLLDAAARAADVRAPRPTARRVAHDAEAAMGSTLAQLREGIDVHPRQPVDRLVAARTSAIAASLVGVLGVLGPDFATRLARPRAEGLRGRRAAARASAS